MSERVWHPKTARREVHPPGPRGVPVFGSLFEAWRDPLRFAEGLARDHGDIASYRIGTYTGYLLNHPDHIRHVLQQNHHNYSKQNYQYKMLKPVLGEGLLTSDGDQWLHERRMIQPVFHRRRISRFGLVTTRATQEMLEAWEVAATHGRPVDIAHEMMRLALRIVGEAVFSIDISSEAGAIGPAFATLNQDVAFRLRTVFVPPHWMPTPRNIAFKRARAVLDRVVGEIIATRRQGGGPADDLLAMVLDASDEDAGHAVSDQQLRDEVMTLLLAGHETTANLLTWTCYLLATHPKSADAMRQELDTVLGGRMPQVEDLPALDYTARVIHESMRLYPPVWIISRIATEDDVIGEYLVPSGTTVALSPYTMHRHPDFWSNPDRFEPERFAPECAKERHPYAYFPFGGGPRRCVGSNFAMMEAQLILATIAQRYRLHVVPGHPVEPEPLVTLRPRHGLQCHLQRM